MKVDKLLIQRKTVTVTVTGTETLTKSEKVGEPEMYDVPDKEGGHEKELQKIAQMNIRKKAEVEDKQTEEPPYTYSYTELVVVELIFPKGTDNEGNIFDEGEKLGFEKVNNPH